MSGIQKNAIISDCGKYRYLLHRRWRNASERFAYFVMLNPSTADAEQDDPTIRRCINFAHDAGCDGFYVVNLFAFRATDPSLLGHVRFDPVGEENDLWLERAVAAARHNNPLVVAWGATHAASQVMRDRIRFVEQLCRDYKVVPSCLGATKDGHPRHPLYVRSDQPLTPYHWRL